MKQIDMKSLRLDAVTIPDHMVRNSTYQSEPDGHARWEVELSIAPKYEATAQEVREHLSNGPSKAGFEVGGEEISGFAFYNSRAIERKDDRIYIAISDKTEEVDPCHLERRAGWTVAKLHRSYSHYRVACRKLGIPASQILRLSDYMAVTAPIYAALLSE